MLSLFVVAALEVENNDIVVGIGAALTFGLFEIVLGKGVVFLSQTEKTGIVENVGVVGVEVASHLEVTFRL